MHTPVVSSDYKNLKRLAPETAKIIRVHPKRPETEVPREVFCFLVILAAQAKMPFPDIGRLHSLDALHSKSAMKEAKRLGFIREEEGAWRVTEEVRDGLLKWKEDELLLERHEATLAHLHRWALLGGLLRFNYKRKKVILDGLELNDPRARAVVEKCGISTSEIEDWQELRRTRGLLGLSCRRM